jgi:hypothetical protein
MNVISYPVNPLNPLNPVNKKEGYRQNFSGGRTRREITSFDR